MGGGWGGSGGGGGVKNSHFNKSLLCTLLGRVKLRRNPTVFEPNESLSST